MKIDLSTVDETQFMVHPHLVSGETCWLVQPQHIGAAWTKDNTHFRSSVWNSNGELISAGFPKFVNWGEKPEVFPVPTSLQGASIVEKLDGSLLIVSKYKGQFILRTRGTVDAYKLDNGHELESFQPILNKLARMYESKGDTWDFSFLFEWLSPTNVIVINYGPEPLFKLIGIVHHHDYSLATQSNLDTVADIIGLDRPKTFQFNNIDEMMSGVKDWKDMEGVVIYTKNGQMLHKLKAETYLVAHRFKSSATFENTVELFFEYGMPSHTEFQEKLVAHFDWECANMVLGFTSTICDGYKTVLKIVEGMKEFLAKHENLSRKDLAAKVFASYGGEGNNRAAFVFTLKDKGELNRDQLMKLMYQVTKN